MNVLGMKIALLFAGWLICAQAQWLNYPAPGTPRMKDGKPNLSAKAPRADNGKPDLSGVWLTEFAPPGENQRLFGESMKDYVVPGDDPRMFSKYLLNILVDFKPEESPMRPEAAEIFRKRAPVESPVAQCMPQSLPRADIHSYAPQDWRAPATHMIARCRRLEFLRRTAWQSHPP